MTKFDLLVNGQEFMVEVDAEMPLLWVLRDILGLVGTKYSCGIGVCGACNVHVDGTLTSACRTPVSSAASREITTIEGLSMNADHRLQRAWIEEHVSQCGYCQPGQIMAAAALLAQVPHPTDDDIDNAMAGNLCRCGTYQRIRRAIHRAAQLEELDR